MNFNFLKNKKAAILCAAFLFTFLGPRQGHSQALDFEKVRAKATELLLQKKKEQSLQLILSFIEAEYSPSKKDEAVEFLVKTAQKFIFREAQEAYENSINLTLENANEAGKSNDRCLTIEPQQLECLIQRMRLLMREKNKRAAQEAILKIKELVPYSKFEVWTKYVGQKNDTEFRNKPVIKTIPDKLTEENMGLLLLELDRSFLAKNYSRAKDLINYFEKHYPAWPDLLFYKHKINLESSEDKQKNNSDASAEQMTLYNNRCKSLSKTTARKFRYDIDLCNRAIL